MKPSLRFLYLHTNDLESARHFYTTLIGLDEFYFQPGESVAYRCDALQFSISLTTNAVTGLADWAIQPGWPGGTSPNPSWSIECEPQEFRAAVHRLQRAGVLALSAEPRWHGYWSFVVRDPLGNTVELSDPKTPEQ